MRLQIRMVLNHLKKIPHLPAVRKHIVGEDRPTPTQVNAGGYVPGTLPGVYAFDDNRTRNHDELAAVLVEEVEAAPSPSHLTG